MITEIKCPKCGRLLAKVIDNVAHINIRTGTKAYTRIQCTGTVSITCPSVRYYSDGSRQCNNNVTVETKAFLPINV